MNRRKIITTVFFAAFLTLSGKAQKILDYSNTNSQFIIKTPAINLKPKNSTIPFIQPHIPFTRIFLETGNGAFFIFTTNTSDGVASNLAKAFLQTWHFNPSKPIQQPLVQLNTYYDTTRIPPMTASIADFNHAWSTAPNTPPQNPFAANEFLRVTPSTNTIIPGDMMTIALTYKNIANDFPSYNKSLLVLCYNGSENSKIFYNVPTGTNAESYQFDGVLVPALRMHNNEHVLTAQEITQLPECIKAKLNDSTKGYNKTIYISVPYSTSIPERNIFLSMSPNRDTLDYQSGLSSVKAILVNYNTCESNFKVQTEPFDIKFLSRDPNNIFTTPNCLNCDSLLTNTSNCSAAYKNKPIDYTIQFENTGAGMAKTIKVTVSIPNGIKFPSLTECNNLFSCKIGENKIDIVRPGGPILALKGLPRYCGYSLKPDSNQIIFTIVNADLAGTVVSKKDKSRSGEIKFRLRTVSNLNTFPACMESKVSIVFDNNSPEPGSSIIRLNCKNAVCPPTYTNSHAGD